MALQSSGAISMSQIGTELSNASRSLRTLSAAAGKSTPDSFSEFYSYSAYSPSFNLSSISGSTSDAFKSTNTTTTGINQTITLRFNLTKNGNDANQYIIVYKNGSAQVQITSGNSDLTGVTASDVFYVAAYNTQGEQFVGTITVTDTTNNTQLDTASINFYREEE
jgi:hypothetical protein